MNPPLSGLPTTGVALPETAVNSDITQLDSNDSSVFGGALEDAYSALSPHLSDQPTPSTDGQDLLAGLQSLPQSGKLLPLLQQTLDKVAAGDSDLKQFLERLTAGLKLLAREATEAPPAEQLALVLQPMVQEQPQLRALLPAEIVSALERATGSMDKAGDERVLRQLSQLVATQKASGQTGDAPSAPVDPTANRDARPVNAEAGLVPQLPPAAPNATQERGAELATLMAAIKRLSPEAPRAPSAETTLASGPTVPSSASSAIAVPSAAAVAVNTPFGQADWDQALGERIQWLASQKVQGAQVKLNPANLGPMEVRIQMHNDQASVQFNAHHAVVRDALEAALPRLRDMFEASGVQLINVDISGGSFAGQQRTDQDTATPRWGPGVEVDEGTAQSVHQTPVASFLGTGRLDLFA